MNKPLINTIHRMPENICTVCGHRLNAAGEYNEQQPPKPGDLSICINCGMIHIFNQDFKIRKLTEDELARAKANPVIWAVVVKLQNHLNEQRGR